MYHILLKTQFTGKIISREVFFFFKSFIYFNLAALGLSCCMWDLAPCPGIEPRPPALGVQIGPLDHQASPSREVLIHCI